MLLTPKGQCLEIPSLGICSSPLTSASPGFTHTLHLSLTSQGGQLLATLWVPYCGQDKDAGCYVHPLVAVGGEVTVISELQWGMVAPLSQSSASSSRLQQRILPGVSLQPLAHFSRCLGSFSPSATGMCCVPLDMSLSFFEPQSVKRECTNEAESVLSSPSGGEN